MTRRPQSQRRARTAAPPHEAEPRPKHLEPAPRELPFRVGTEEELDGLRDSDVGRVIGIDRLEVFHGDRFGVFRIHLPARPRVE